MKQISTALATHMAGEVLTPADCVRITKVDGSVLALTSHDREITFEGTTYLSGATFDLSAIKSSADFSVDNAEITIAIDGERLTKAELLGDNLREAEFEIFTVNWMDLSQGKLPLKSGNIGEITLVDDLYAKIQLRGLFQKLSRGFLDVYSPTCRASFGDSKCGFAVLPTRIRVPGAKYKTSDWFLVPQVGVVIPTMTNLSFEANGVVANTMAQSITGWLLSAGSAFKVQNVIPSEDGSYYLEGGDEGGGVASGAVMIAHQDITTSAAGMPSLQVDNGNFSFSFTASIRRTTTAKNLGGVSLLFLNAAGNVIAKKTTGVKLYSDTEWTRVNLTEIVPTGTRRIRLMVEAHKNVGASAAVAFDNISVQYWQNDAATFGNVMYKVIRIPAWGASDRVPLTNNTFTADGVVPNGPAMITNWTPGAGAYFATTTFAGPLVSTFGPTFLIGGDDGSATQKTYSLAQTRDVKTATSIIDNGGAYARVTGQAALTASGSALEIKLSFLTSASAVISTQSFPLTLSVGTWTTFDERVLMPVGTRKIKVTIEATSPVGDSNAAVALSTIDAYELNLAHESPEDALYGRSSNAVPSLDSTIDALSDDGELILQARPLIFDYATVSNVITDRTIETPVLPFTAQEMYGGKVRWISGRNAGKTSIVRAYNPGTNLLTMYDTLAANAAVGDRFIITRGCDKKIATCGALRNNMNFRGEPYLPGTSKVITYFTPAA